MKLKLISFEIFDGYIIITINYEYKDSFGTLQIDDINDDKNLCVNEIHTKCIDAYGKDFENVCNTLNNLLVDCKTKNDAENIIKRFSK